MTGTAPTEPVLLDDAISAAWANVEASWGDEAEHRKFLAVCEALGRLDEAGRRYAAVRDSSPERAAEAQGQIDSLVARAMSQIQLLKADVDPRPRRIVHLVGILLAFGLIGFALSFFFR